MAAAKLAVGICTRHNHCTCLPSWKTDESCSKRIDNFSPLIWDSNILRTFGGLLNQFSALEALLFLHVLCAMVKFVYRKDVWMPGFEQVNLLHTAMVVYDLHTYGPAVFAYLGYVRFMAMFACCISLAALINFALPSIRQRVLSSSSFTLALKLVLVMGFGQGDILPTVLVHLGLEYILSGQHHQIPSGLSGIICSSLFVKYFTT